MNEENINTGGPAVSDVVRDVFASHDAFSIAIEAKLKEKNT